MIIHFAANTLREYLSVVATILCFELYSSMKERLSNLLLIDTVDFIVHAKLMFTKVDLSVKSRFAQF